MHLFARTLAAMSTGLVAACSSGRPPTDAVVIPDGSAAATLGASAVIDAGDGRWPEDPIAVTATAVRGDSLHLTVQYGGGCAEHRIALVFRDTWLESYPVQVPALLSHDANGDTCRALLTRDVAFSLRPLREAYQRAYRADTGTVVFTLRPTSTRVAYTF